MKNKMEKKPVNKTRTRVGKQKFQWTLGRLLFLASFVLPVMIMLIGFGICGIYPFGGRSFLSMDMYHQYMPFFSEFMSAIKSGEGISHTWNVGIGSNFLALYVYYLASPFHWLGLAVPERFYIEFLSYLVVFKIGLCGLTSFLYFRERGKDVAFQGKGGTYIKPELLALFFSMFYALSGFLAAYNWNIMWLDCVILLPLIVLGLERLVKDGKPGLYCVALGLSIFTNYYISIMICIFLVFYFVYLYCTTPHTVLYGKQGLVSRFKTHMKPVGQFALYSLLAGGMAAVLLIPEVCAILETDFGNSQFPTKVESYFSVMDMLARHCVGVSVEKGLDHWPNIYCGAAVFLFVPLYVLSDKISARKRFGMLGLAALLLLGFSTNVFDFMWHGFNYPDSLPARQSFIYILLLLIMCFEACRHCDISKTEGKESVVRLYLGAVVAMLVVEKFAEHEDVLPGVEWLTLLFISIYAAALYLAHTRTSIAWKNALVWVVLAAVLLETGVNTCCTSIANVNRSDYLEHQEDYKALYSWTREQQDGFYRVEKFTRKTKNDGTLAGYPTASVFSSTLNSRVKDMYERLGMRHSKVYYAYDGATALTSAMLNVAYMFGEENKYENSLYTMCNSSNELYLYQAEYTLPFGYVAPTGFDLPEGFTGSAIRMQNQMVHDLGIKEQLFVKCKVDASGDDVLFSVAQEGVYYGIVTASGTSKIKKVGGGQPEEEYKDLKKGSILYLGAINEGSMVTLVNSDEEDKSKNIVVEVYRLDEDVLSEVLAILSKNHLEEVTYDTSSLSGRISLDQAGRMILSIPYEKGWTVKFNGEKLEPEIFGGSLMAFDLEAGEYELTMHYVPYGRGVGILISVLSISVFAGLMWLRKKKEHTEEY